MIYDFKCECCGRVAKDIVLPMTHSDDEHPRCCDRAMADFFTVPPTILWTDADLPDGGFVSGKNKERITTKKERREFMARNDLVDANELGPPPNKAAQMEQFKDTMKTIDAITPDAQQEDQLKSSGLMDLVK